MAEEELLLAIVVPCNMHVKHIQKKKKKRHNKEAVTSVKRKRKIQHYCAHR